MTVRTDAIRKGERVWRFAPTPNGPLHLGHALSAILNAGSAARTGGRFLVRLEDVDRTRARPAFEAGILDDLRWLGLSWEEPVLRQSERTAAYADAIDALAHLGLVYPAFLSRTEIAARMAEHESHGAPWPRDPDGAPLYPGDERNWSEAVRARALADGRPHALRLDMARALEVCARKVCARGGVDPLRFADDDGEGGPAAEVTAAPERWGDVVLSRRDAPASYHLAVVLDDAWQGVTDVLRGRDLLAATDVHRLLQTLLGLPEPRYHHHRLLLGPDGRKLSKSQGAEGLASLRAAGWTPVDVHRCLGLAG